MGAQAFRTMQSIAPTDYKGCKELLRKYRHDNIRSSQVILACADVLFKSRGSLGDEVWALLEQDTMAALDLNQLDRARRNIKELRTRFGESSLRISILDGMLLEAGLNWDKATKLYEGIVAENEGHQMAMMRLIAIAKGQGKFDKMLELLREYVEIHQTDQSAWLELANAYIAAGEYKFASFCCEDLILLQPYNWLFHIKYAEVLYTIGGTESMELAKKEYMQSFELKPDNNPRALYGVCLCVSTLGAGSYSKHAAQQIKQMLMDEFDWAAGELRKLYKPAQWKYVEVGLDELKSAIKI